MKSITGMVPEMRLKPKMFEILEKINLETQHIYPWSEAEGVAVRLTDLLCHSVADRDGYLTNSRPDAFCRDFMS